MIIPARMPVRCSRNIRAIWAALAFGDGGGMNPATPQKPASSSTTHAIPLQVHVRSTRPVMPASPDSATVLTPDVATVTPDPSCGLHAARRTPCSADAPM
jgi:hypothetical protein